MSPSASGPSVRRGRSRRSGLSRSLLFACAGLVLATDASAWCNIGASCNTSWSHRRKLTFDNSTQPANLNNFAVLVVLNGGRINYGLTKDDGSDLRFVDSDDGTLLDHEIERWDESGNSYVWVRVPQIPASTNTDFVWMYYGNPAAAALPLANQRATWNANYVMVQHLQETAGAHLDSTANGNDSSLVDVQTQGSPTGRIDGADIFNSASAHNIDVPDAASLDMVDGDTFTVEAWIRTSSGAQQMVVSKENGAQEIQLWVNAGVAAFWVNDGANFARAQGGPALSDGAWHYLVGRWSDASGTAEIFVDGASQAANTNGAVGSMATATPLVIGEEGDANRGFNFTGTIDEVRVRRGSSSNDWIYAQYLTQSDSGAGQAGPFVSFGPEAAHCCALGVTETPTTITVNGPNRFDIQFDTTKGGGIARFVDAEENTGVDLAGGNDATSSQPALFADEFQTGSGVFLTSADTVAKLELLESTRARVRVRAEAFYSLVGSATILPGVKGLGTYSLYAPGRMALDWNRVVTTPVAYNVLELNTTVHWQPTGSLNGWAAYGQSGPLAQGGGEDFTLLRNEQPGARTDFLHILSTDWVGADGTGTFQIDGGGAQEWKEATWFDNTPGTLSASQSFKMLFYFKPTTLGVGASPWLDAAVTSRSTDYRSPSAVTVGPGSQWQDADENTAVGGDFFNEAEAAYAFNLDPASGLTFTMDGSATTRRSPFFKIRRWQSFTESPVVTFDPDGPGAAPATPLQPGRDYRAAVKPVARAHFAQGLLWYSTFESSGKVNPPVVGNGLNTVESGIGYAAARYGNGAVFNAATDDIRVIMQPGAGLANIELDAGRIEFWLQPNWAPNDGVEHYFFDTDIDGTGTNNSRIRLKKEAAGLANVLRGEVYDSTGTSRGVTIPLANYSWRAGEWIHLAIEWDSADPTDNVRVYLNGVPLVPSAVANGTFTMLAETASGILRIGNRAFSPGFFNADGIMDEFRIYSAVPQEIAHGGLTSDVREKLANASDNFPLGLQPIDGFSRGRYLFFGSDTKVRGFNVSLATPGTAVGDTQVQWFFWNGSDWQQVFPVDGTNSFKRTGTIWWNPDWPGWAPYSVGGGPDLYYMMARLGPGASYGVTPVEQVINTDVLLFEYCHDVTTAQATFAFAVPPTTEVKLASFTASPGDGSVLLEWRTASELRNLGFHLYRSESGDGPWARLTTSLIPGLGSSAVGQAYSYRDGGLLNGTRYYYRLEDVDASSRTTSHGPVSAVPQAGAPGSGEAGSGSSGSGKKKASSSASCPDWVVSAYASSVGSEAGTSSLRCTRHGDPEAVSLEVLGRDSRSATLELRTGGFYALHAASGAGEASGVVRVFVPGFDFPQGEQSLALPIRRALLPAVVGRRVHLGGVRALELVSFPGLAPGALGKAEMQVGRDGTVRAVRRGLRDVPERSERGVRGRDEREAVARSASGAEEWVKLLPSLFQGEKKSAVVELAPLRFDSQRRQLVLAKRVRVRLLFTGREAGESGRGSLGRAPRPEKPVSGEVLARLYTTSLGLHAVGFEQLFPGRTRGLSASELRLERQGEAVGFHLEPSSAGFGPGGRLFFHAERTAASTDFSGELAYELVRSRDGARMPVQSAAPGSNAIATASSVGRWFETNRFYQPGLLEAPDLWLWDGLPSGATRAQSFSLSGTSGLGGSGAGSESATLVVDLQGASESGQAVDHHVSVSVNGVALGEARFAGKRPYRMSLGVPMSLMREGSNELQLTNVADTGVSSFVFLDRFRVEHPQASSLVAGRFEGAWAESGSVSVQVPAGVSGPIRVVDVTGAGDGAASGAGTRSTNPIWLTGLEVTSAAVRFRAEAGRSYRVQSDSALLSPRVVQPEPSGLKSAGNQADYLLIAPRAFLTAAGPLVERRRDQGLEARAVAFEEIADEFGRGQPSAEAIRGFLAYAYQSWAQPSPRYVLLLGDSSYDPRNFSGSSQPSPLPALWAKTSYLWTSSDPLLAAVNGEDGLPDLAIGRLPATTLAQAEALVRKLLAWEDSGQGLAGAAALVADNPDPAGDFEADVRDIAQSYLAERNPQLLFLSQLGSQTRQQVREALNNGLSFLSYVGHGGAAVWASENVWNSWDAPSLQAQSRQPLLVTMNCLNGYFVAPGYESLSESLLKAEGRGAIAAFSPSGLSLDGPAHRYHSALMAELTGGRHERLGDAILAAQQAYAQSGLMPELLSIYHLLGDPATRIR